jgi:hypothetical protein
MLLTSMPPSLVQIFEPIEALLADEDVRQIVLDGELAIRRGSGWAYRSNPLPAETFDAAVDALIDALSTDEDSSAIEMQLDDAARLVAMRPPAADRPWLAILRPDVAPQPTMPGRVAETVDVALSRELTCLIVGPSAADRHAWMAALARRDTLRPVGIDMQVAIEGARQLRSSPDLAWARLVRVGALMGPGRLYWDATPHGAEPMVSALMARVAPACVGMPGRTAQDGFFGLTAWLPMDARAQLASAIDLIVCVDGERLEEVVAVSSSASGAVLDALQRTMPSGGVSDERAHAEWMARWQRLDRQWSRTTSLPPQSLTEALRAVRQQVQPAEPVRVTLRPDGDVPQAPAAVSQPPVSRDSVDPLQALLASLGDAEDSADVEDENEVTIVQAEGVLPEANHRTFSEILRSLGESGEGRMHVRRADRVTKLGDSD